MSNPRYFVISGAATQEEFHDRVERHGKIVRSHLFDAEVCPDMVYGIVEITPHEERES